MSSKRGDVQRSRPQRHQNKTAFKNDLHDNSDKIKKLNSMCISEVCLKCKEVIQWKIKYRKYKPLTQPKTCNRCKQKTIKSAYHVLCRECAFATKQCAKCLKKESDGVEIIQSEKTELEKIRMDNELKQLIKSLSERKRRTFLRYMNGKQKKKNKGDDDGDDDEEEVEKNNQKLPLPTRDELMEKFKQLNVDKDHDDFYDDIISDSDDEEGWASELSD